MPIGRWLIGGEAIVGLIYLPAFLILREQAPGWVASSWLTFTTDSLAARIGDIYLDWNLWGAIGRNGGWRRSARCCCSAGSAGGVRR